MGNPLESLCEAESNITLCSVPSVELNQIATEILNDAIVLWQSAIAFQTEWQQRHNPTEPILATLEDCVELFQQDYQVRFPDDLFESVDEFYYPKDRESAPRCGSSKEAMPTLEQIHELAHAEDVDAWVEIVRTIATQQIELGELVGRSGLSVVQVWIAVLFGGFSIERCGDFYEGMIFVEKSAIDNSSIAPTVMS